MKTVIFISVFSALILCAIYKAMKLVLNGIAGDMLSEEDSDEVRRMIERAQG